MDITFQKAKNGETTALIGNLYLHSAYNPQREAERFVDNLQNPFCPKIVIITEPGIAYVKNYLRKKFPESKIGLIRYIRGFEEYNKGFDFVINYFENSNNFDNFLLQFFGEEALLETFFCKWEVSSKIFPEIDIKVWHSIKNALENAKTLLITRQYFEKKWLTNTFNFIRYLKNPLLLKSNINFPLLIIASGSSLRAFLPIIKQNQSKFFIIVLSSAIKVCIDNGIKADLALSTDGGYWAGQHLKSLYKNTLVLGGSHSIGVPLATAGDYSYIAPSATMIVHPIRTNGLVIGINESFEYFKKMQERINEFITRTSHIERDELNRLLHAKDELITDVGSVLIGKEAVECGLIDEVGGLKEALAKFRDLIKEDEDKNEGDN